MVRLFRDGPLMKALGAIWEFRDRITTIRIVQSMEKLEGRTAIVTGASRGIGKAVAVMLGREGANVVATARTKQAIDSLARNIVHSGGNALAVEADLSIDSDVQRIADETLAKFGRIDILVNNAAIIHPSVNLVDFDFDLWRKVIAVNLEAAALLTKHCLPSMIENSYGKVINISSIGGRKGGKGRSAYRVTKSALISLTESVAAEVKPYGIDVNCICPGGVDTEGYREAFATRGKADDPNMMAPEEIANLVVFLASDDSSSVTGTAIDAFGGTNPLFD
ncbi:MAG: SDR family oxidoreductase [SAR202 cluster bacterium]|jgi:3-oxoacyl-[acyl-carrier protein] reductase|nr:SDR family oxidoreductase [SAR202 cluster bacterium]MDP6514800.1 SDR family oxidoreductase [SAR202 cluster bacterium]MDP6713667.1 SDR family oxidoreductase [SAR202 cluster bacterium]